MGFAVTMRRPLRKMMTTMNPCSFSSLAIRCRLLSSSSSSKSPNTNPNPFSSSSSSAIGGGIPNPSSRAPPSPSLFNRNPNFIFRRSHSSSSPPPVVECIGGKRYVSAEDHAVAVTELRRRISKVEEWVGREMAALEEKQQELQRKVDEQAADSKRFQALLRREMEERHGELLREIEERHGETQRDIEKRHGELQRMIEELPSWEWEEEGTGGSGSLVGGKAASRWLLAAAFAAGWQARGALC